MTAKKSGNYITRLMMHSRMYYQCITSYNLNRFDGKCKMIGTQFIKQQIDEGHLLLRVIPLSPPTLLKISKLESYTQFYTHF